MNYHFTFKSKQKVYILSLASRAEKNLIVKKKKKLNIPKSNLKANQVINLSN